MNEEDRKLVVSELINALEELKAYIGPQSLGRPILNRAIRLSKRLYVQALKAKDATQEIV